MDQLHNNIERNGRDLGSYVHNKSNDLVKDNQDDVFNDKKLTNIVSVTVNKNPTSANEVTNKKYVNDSIDATIFRFNQTLEKYLKVSVGNDTYNLTKYYKIKFIHTTIIQRGNGQYLLIQWKVVSNDKNKNGVTTNFIRATKTNSRTKESGATSLPPIGDSFMYIETSSNNHGQERVFVN